MAFKNTLFAQLLSQIPHFVLNKLEDKYDTGRKNRKLGLIMQFKVLAYLQLTARTSMRDALRCLDAKINCLYHWGLTRVARSTLADANASRPVGFFKDLFAEMYKLCVAKSPKHKFRFKSKLYSLDATTISLCHSLFPWAKFTQYKSGIKLHTLLDHNGYIPSVVIIRNANQHEGPIAKLMDLPQRGSILVFDKGYYDYGWFQILAAKGLYFVTRIKMGASYVVVERRSVKRKTNVKADLIIDVFSKQTALRLRLIRYRDPDSGKIFEFITNNFKLVPQTIADIYKDRWQVEAFFKEIKQNLKIKHFVGNSENAVMIQVYTALITYLLVKYQKFLSKIERSAQQLLQLIQVNLQCTASLEELVNPPQTRKKENPRYLSLFQYIS